MCFLQFGIRLGQCGPRFAQPEAQLTEHPLALADPDADTVLLLNPSTECFSIPEVSAQASTPPTVPHPRAGAPPRGRSCLALPKAHREGDDHIEILPSDGSRPEVRGSSWASLQS